MNKILKKFVAIAAFAMSVPLAFGEAVETVAYWHKDFANGSVKNGFTMSLGEGTTVNADGTVTLAKQASSKATPTHGVEISFTDDQGNSVFPGYELTVIVKYSGLDFTTSRFSFLSTIWGDNKDAAETVLVAKSKNQMYYLTGVTASEKSDDIAMSAIKQTIPASGYMLVSLSGYQSGNTGCWGTRIGFASGEGDFLDYGYQEGLRYTGKSFYGIKVGGTVGKINDFFRPGMKVEGVAIVKGFTTTMKTFRYLFPDECYHFDYADKNPTSETKYLEGLTVKDIKDAVFSAKLFNNSVEWANGMVTACQKAFTPDETTPTKIALQYQVYNKDYYKSADIYFTDKTDGIYFKKTGGRYNATTSSTTKPTTPPAENKLGTDDATWSNKSSNYHFNDFSVYVPYTQTATATTGGWSALGWTGDDIARLDVTGDATLTVDAASAVGALKAMGPGKLTLKYTDAAKLIAGKNWDFTEATGKIAFDCADLDFEGQVVLMSGTIRGSENIDAEGSSLPENTTLIVSDTAVVLKGAYTATVEEDVNFSDIKWTPDPAGVLEEDAVFVIKNTNAVTVTFAENLTAGRLIVENSAAMTLLKDEATLTIGAFDFTKADVVLEFDPGETAIVIGEGKTLTMKASGLKKSRVANNGTIAFEGGTEDDPIAISADVNGASFGTMRLAASTYVLCTESGNTDRVYDVSGEGPDSCFALTRGNAPVGPASGSKFSGITFVATSPSKKNCWSGNADIYDETVHVYVKSSNFHLATANASYVIGSLRGTGGVTRYNGNETLDIQCSQEAKFEGASSVPFVIGGTEVQTLSGAYTGALTVNAGATVRLEGNAAPSSISGEGHVIVGSDIAALDLGTSRPTATFTFEGETEVRYTENIVDDGTVYELTLEDGETPTYKVYDVNGNEKAVVEGKYVPGVSGKVAWYDFSFTNTLKSVGTATTTLTRDYSNGLDSKTSAYTSTSNAIFTAIDGYMDPTYPTEWSAAVYATVPKVPNAVLMAFGTKNGGSIALIAGNTNDNEIVLARTTGNAPYETLATMKVPNAFTTPHLYSFCKSDKEIKIYLDEALWSTYTSASSISFGNGFQLGSLFEGVGKTGFVQYGKTYYDAEVEANNSTVGALRMYKAILGPNAIRALAKEFPYVSPNGSFSRTLPNEKQAFWMADGQWTNDKTAEAVNQPDAGAAVKLTGVTTTEVLVNLAADTTYESITLNGDSESVLTIKAGGFASFPGQIKADGAVTVNAPVWLDCTAIDISGVPLTVTANGAITFDLVKFPFNTYFEDAYVPLTGISAVYDGQVFAALPKETPNREVTLGYDSATQTYGITITVDKTIPFVYTIDADEETGVWTWDEQELDEATVLALSAANIVKKGTGTQRFVGTSKFAYTVDAGTLMFTNNVQFITPTITINPGATFDMNGKPNSEYNIVLAGGALVNNGDLIGGQLRQMTGITLTDNSTVGGTNSFGLVSGDYAANTLDLGGKTLTKTGENFFFLCNTTVTNGTLDVKEGTLRVLNRQATFADDAKLVMAKGTTLYNTYPVTIGAITADGATIQNDGSITPFTLTGSATFTGSGKWGTNTLDNATVDVGNLRGLAFAGTGTVNVTLSNKEIGGDAVTVFTTESAVTIGKVYYNDEDVTAKCTATGGTIVAPLAEAKVGTTYYLTLQEALSAGGDVTLLKDVALDEALDPIAMTVTLDMAEKTISSTVIEPLNVTTNGSLTITGNGTISGPANGQAFDGKCVVCVDGGTLNYVNGTLTATGSGADGMYGVYVLNGGTATFGTSEGGPAITAHFAAIGANNTTAPCAITVNGGSYTQQADGKGQWWSYFCAAVYAPANGIYTINGGEFTGALYCLATRYVAEQTITFADGTFNQPLFIDEQEGATTGERTITKTAELEIALADPDTWEWKNGTTLAKKSVGPEPVTPGEPIEVPTGADPATFVQQVEDNKATLLTAPEDVLEGEELTEYQALFTAALDGTVVKFVLNEDGTNTVVEAMEAVNTAALDVALSEEPTLTIADPLKGFYYSLKQGGDVTDLGFNAEGDKNKLAGKDTIEFSLEKPENAGFYQTLVTPTEYSEE